MNSDVLNCNILVDHRDVFLFLSFLTRALFESALTGILAAFLGLWIIELMQNTLT